MQRGAGNYGALEKAEMKRSSLPLIGLVLLALAVAASGILFLPVPFTRDQGIYSYVAWCWLGEWWPYQYAFEHKGPWLYLTYAIFLKLSKGAAFGPNLADLLARLSTLFLLFILGKKLFPPWKALAVSAVASIPLLAVFSSCWWNDQAETFMMPIAALSALLAFSAANDDPRPKSLGLGFAAGLALSQMLMFKLSGFWLVIGLVFFFAFFAKARMKTISACLIGLAAGLAVWIFYFWVRGIGGEFFEQVILFNWFHLQGHRASPAELLKTSSRALWLIFGPALIILAAGLARAFRARREPVSGLVLIWFAAAALELLSQARFFLYHFLGLISPCALLIVMGASGGKGKQGKAWRWLGASLIIIWAFTSLKFYCLTQKHYQTANYLSGKLSKEQYYARFQEPARGPRKDFNAYADLVVANWIRERTTGDDYVLVFGYEPLINYLAARRSPSRFHSKYPLDFEPKTNLARRRQKQWRDTFLSELNTRKPRLVVLVHNDINALEPLDSYSQALRFREFWTWLMKNYRRGERIEDFDFWWRRRDGFD